MTVYRKETILRHHAFTSLRLAHVAFVDSYECHSRGNKMSVNRLLFICGGDTSVESSIKDLNTGKVFPMKPGCLYFIPCNHMVDLHIEPKLTFVSWQFNLDLFYGFDVFDTYKSCEMIEDPSLVAEAKQLIEKEKQLTTLYRINELIYHFCATWISNETMDTQKTIVKLSKYEKALKFIQQSGDAMTTVGMLADIENMRQDVFSRTFTRDLGFSPKEFLIRDLIQKSSKMLLTPGATVNGVAKQLNFSSEYYFSTFFKKHTGKPPTQFKHSHLG
jgi:AraC-like DNA-binding protein